MIRGDIIIVAPPGEFGKPRPAVIIQADLSMNEDTITFIPITSELDRSPLSRVLVDPTPTNGLRKRSDLMVDRIQTSSLSRIGGIIGRLDRDTMRRIEAALMVHLGLA